MHDHDCEAEVYDQKHDRRPDAPAWRPCRNPAAAEYKGVHLCTQHIGCAVAGREVNLTGGRVLSRRKAVTVE